MTVAKLVLATFLYFIMIMVYMEGVHAIAKKLKIYEVIRSVINTIKRVFN